MRDKLILDLFQIKNRFLRSAQLERDFTDPDAISGYVFTDFAHSCLERVAAGLKPKSSQRAWRMTGDYGSGKSSFALLLAHWFSGNDSVFPPQIRKAVNFHQFGVSKPYFVPVPELAVLGPATRGRLMFEYITAFQKEGATKKNLQIRHNVLNSVLS